MQPQRSLPVSTLLVSGRTRRGRSCCWLLAAGRARIDGSEDVGGFDFAGVRVVLCSDSTPLRIPTETLRLHTLSRQRSPPHCRSTLGVQPSLPLPRTESHLPPALTSTLHHSRRLHICASRAALSYLSPPTSSLASSIAHSLDSRLDCHARVVACVTRRPLLCLL